MPLLTLELRRPTFSVVHAASSNYYSVVVKGTELHLSNLFAAALFTASLASAATGIDKISAYNGTWKSQTVSFATPYSKPGKESLTIKNQCWRTANYYACEQFVDGKSSALSVYTYNSKDDVYSVYGVPSDGSDAHRGKLIIKDNVWTFPWQEQQQGKTIYFQVVNVFTSPTTIEYRQEFSSDNIHWTVMSKGSEQRQP